MCSLSLNNRSRYRSLAALEVQGCQIKQSLAKEAKGKPKDGRNR
jgi:hypothetical protein